MRCLLLYAEACMSSSNTSRGIQRDGEISQVSKGCILVSDPTPGSAHYLIK